MARYSYCNRCKKEVDKAIRKPITTFHKIIWIILILGTAGIAFLVFVICYFNRKKEYCPICNSKLEVASEPIDKDADEHDSLPLTPKEKVLKKAGKNIPTEKKPREEKVEKKEEMEQIKPESMFCPYCGQKIKPNAKRCPYCGSSL